VSRSDSSVTDPEGTPSRPSAPATDDMARSRLIRVPGRGYDAAALHRSILSGLVSSIGRLDEKGEYVGPRGVRFAIFPGSALHRSEAPWIMAAELVETTRLYARTCAKIRSDWVERVAPHLVRREHFEPHWRRGVGQVAAWERVSMQGLVVIAKRRVPYGPIDPKAARDIFIQAALVDEQIATDGGFLDHNRELLERLEVEETKRRQHGGSIDASARFDFYDARVPPDIHSTPSFESWRRGAERGRPRLLYMSESDLRRDGSTTMESSDFPDSVEFGSLRLPLEYRHEPGDPDDGVTVTVPIAALPQVSEERIRWLVPGLLRELMTALIRTLPKRLRVRFVPAAEYADGACEALPFGEGALLERLGRHLHRLTGSPIAASDFRVDNLPTHLRMNIRVIDADGKELECGRDLTALKRRHGARARESLTAVGDTSGSGEPTASTLARPVSIEAGLQDFPPDGLAERVEIEQGGMRVVAHPALVDEGASAAVRLFPTAPAARRATRLGLRRLALIALHDEIRPMLDFLPSADGTPGLDRLALLYAPFGRRESLEDALALRIAEVALLPSPQQELPRTPAAFAELLAEGRPKLWQTGVTVIAIVERVISLRHEVARTLEAPLPSTWEACVSDVQRQLRMLLPNGFITATPWEWFGHIPRYLLAIQQRFESMRGGGHARDVECTAELHRHLRRLEGATQEATDDSADGLALGDTLERYRWLIEEYRVSLFAQRLRTSVPVSAERLDRFWRDATESRAD